MKPEATPSRTALLALATLALSLPITLAQLTPQTVPNPGPNDIYAGFRSTDTTKTRSYLIYLGNYTTLFSSVSEGGSISLNLGSPGTDLSNEFGSDWFSSPNLRWGVFGTNKGENSQLVFGSRERSAPDNPAVPWPAIPDSTRRNLVGTSITSVLESLDGYRSRLSTENSLVGTFQPNASEASSYYFQVAPSGADFGGTTEWSSIEGEIGRAHV